MIYDCFPFFNEFDLLDMRFKILNDYVDKFVLVEADAAYNSKPKPFYFEENKRRFYPYINKIIHISVDNMPKSQDTWVNEHFLRNQISRGLAGCNPNDIVIISDVDEIPNPDAIKNYIPGSGINMLIQSLHYYYLDYRCAVINKRKADRWFLYDAARICQFKDIRSDIQTIRTGWRYKLCPQIMNGGWHFTHTGGVKSILEKLEALADKQYDDARFKDEKRLIKCIEENKDLFGRNYKYVKVPIDEHYPKYIRDNIPLLKEKGLIV